MLGANLLLSPSHNTTPTTKTVRQQIQISPTVESEPQPSAVVVSLSLSATSGSAYVNISPELAIRLPAGARVSGNSVSINGAEYEIDISNSQADLCPMEDFEATCDYTDEKLSNVDILRLWKNESGVFALNPQSIVVGDHFINNFKIYKMKPSNVFAPSEVELWRGSLRNIEVVK